MEENWHLDSFEKYQSLYNYSIKEPADFWSNAAKELYWKKWDDKNILSWNFNKDNGPIDIKWLDGCTTNICYNIIDRNIAKELGDRVAIYWYCLLITLFTRLYPALVYKPHL